MKKIAKFIGITTIIAVIGFGAALTACSDGGGGPSSGSGGGGGTTQIFTSIAAFKTWLNAQPANTAATAYNVKLNVSDLGGAYSDSGSAGNALITNLSKYVNLDLSGSTFTSIEYDVFFGCSNLTSVTIPSSVTSIVGDASYGCTGLTAINVDAANTAYSSENGVLYNKTKITLIKYPPGKTGSFTIPNGVTSIGEGAFAYCTGLTSVTIPNNITNIEDGAFYECTNLASVTIGNGVTSIGNSAFDGCTSLTGITIPDNVTNMGEQVFCECTNLTSITIGNGVTNMGKDVFYECTSLTSITIGNSVTTIDTYAFFRCTSLTSIIIPNSVISIRKLAFSGCTSLTSVTFAVGSNIAEDGFEWIAFPQGSQGSGDSLKNAYLAASPKAGTYTRAANGSTWTKTS